MTAPVSPPPPSVPPPTVADLPEGFHGIFRGNDGKFYKWTYRAVLLNPAGGIEGAAQTQEAIQRTSEEVAHAIREFVQGHGGLAAVTSATPLTFNDISGIRLGAHVTTWPKTGEPVSTEIQAQRDATIRTLERIRLLCEGGVEPAAAAAVAVDVPALAAPRDTTAADLRHENAELRETLVRERDEAHSELARMQFRINEATALQQAKEAIIDGCSSIVGDGTTSENLLPRLGLLKAQAARATAADQTIAQLEEGLARAQEAKHTAEEHTHEANIRAAHAETEASRVPVLTRQLTESDARAAQLSADLRDRKAELADTQRVLQDQTRRANDSIAELARLRDTIGANADALREQVRTANATIEQQRAALETARRDLQAQTRRANDSVAESTRLRDTTGADADALRGQVRTANATIEQQRAALEAAQRDLQAQTRRANDSVAESTRLRDTIGADADALRGQVHTANATIEQQRAALETAQHDLQVQTARANASAAESTRLRGAIDADVVALREQVHTLEAELMAARATTDETLAAAGAAGATQRAALEEANAARVAAVARLNELQVITEATNAEQAGRIAELEDSLATQQRAIQEKDAALAASRQHAAQQGRSNTDLLAFNQAQQQLLEQQEQQLQTIGQRIGIEANIGDENFADALAARLQELMGNNALLERRGEQLEAIKRELGIHQDINSDGFPNAVTTALRSFSDDVIIDMLAEALPDEINDIRARAMADESSSVVQQKKFIVADGIRALIRASRPMEWGRGLIELRQELAKLQIVVRTLSGNKHHLLDNMKGSLRGQLIDHLNQCAFGLDPEQIDQIGDSSVRLLLQEVKNSSARMSPILAKSKEIPPGDITAFKRLIDKLRAQMYSQMTSLNLPHFDPTGMPAAQPLKKLLSFLNLMAINSIAFPNIEISAAAANLLTKDAVRCVRNLIRGLKTLSPKPAQDAIERALATSMPAAAAAAAAAASP